MDTKLLAGDFVTIKEAANKKGVKPQALYRWIMRHGVQTEKIGHYHVIRLSELVAYK